MRDADDQATMLAGSAGAFASGDADRTILAGTGGGGFGTSPGADETVLGASSVGPGPARTDIDQATVLAGPETLARVSAVKSKFSAEEGPLAVGEAFGTRYHIIRLLGIGGMGAVYQAWDAELAVAVAIKVIRPEVMADPGAAAEIEKRFKRELLLARQVTHKNVVRIHDLGEINGIKYITMPYVDGADLSTILRKEGRLTPARTLRIARAVVAGLTEAHKKDVVHRDLKPANIMVDADDDAMIMDFGIARSTGAPVAGPMPGNTTIVGDLRRAASTPDATVLGAVIGTVEYMAPEQAKGQPVDQRADVYAFGLIMYDMLTGRPRAQHMGSAVAELQSRMVQAPPPAKSFVPDIPPALDAVVSRCLEPDAAKRFQTSQELAEALSRLDDRGNAVRIKRVVGVRLAAAVLMLVVAVLGTTWWFTRGPAPEVQHDPVSVLIADFQNTSGDSTFDRTLEPILKLALEGAGFISAFDRSGVTNLGVKAPDKLDEAAARGIAIKQGLPVVVAGSIERQGGGYGVSLKAMQAVTGEVITTVSDRAASKDNVLGVATKLATSVREALGDRPKDSESAIFVKDTLSTSLDVVRHYAAGTEALSRGKFEDALRSFTESTNLDKDFGMGYQGMAIASRNLGRQADAERYINEALKHLDRMTERERYRARGFFYRTTLDWGKCVQEYGELIKKYSADVAAHNQRALCSTHLRELKTARDEMRDVVAIVPKGAIFRINLGIYASYAGDFQMGEQEARKALEFGSPWGWQVLALAQTGLGQLTEAAESYRHLGEAPEAGPSYAASGLGDLATYEGRYEDAVKILQAAAAADLASKDTDRAAARFAAVAYAQLSRKQNAAAVAAAEKALENSKSAQIRFLAARILVEGGQPAQALPIGESLVAELQAEPQAYGKIIQGEAALKKGDARPAIKLFTEANTLLDSWMGRFDLGRAYLAEGMFIQADSEFDRCISRRGEALSLFLDEEPTYAYFPLVYYYQGRVREGMKSAGYAESYRNYLSIREKAGEDPLISEVRRRLGT